MKNVVIIFFLILFGFFGYGQTPKLEDFTGHSSYILDSISTTVGESDLTLYLATRKTEFGSTFIWLTQKQADSILHYKYLGQTESEYGFYIPSTQPLADCFIIVECNEYNGIIHLIKSNGNWIEIPGYYYMIKDDKLYTKASGDGIQTVAKYDLTQGILEKKNWNNINGDDPWKIKGVYNYQNNQWLGIY